MRPLRGAVGIVIVVLVAALLALLTGVAAASASQQEPVELFRGNTERPQVALTFDCGPWVAPLYLNGILDALDEYNHRVTFFVTGQFLEVHEQLFATRMLRHEIGNHSYSHPNFPQMSADGIRQEMRWAEEMVNRHGLSTKGMWRAPFGARNPWVLQIAAEEGYPLHVMWSADSGDWLPVSAERVKSAVLNRSENGSIIVQHCNSWQTAAVLPDILWQLKEWNMQVVTVSEIAR